MKYTALRAMGLALALSGGLLATSDAMADAADTKQTTVAPNTIEGIWQAIDAKTAELKRTIDTGALDDVHHQAFAIRDLAAALPARSTSLPADKLAKVRGGVKYVATLAERLDTTGDAKDLVGTKQNYAKLTAVLASLRANYSLAK